MGLLSSWVDRAGTWPPAPLDFLPPLPYVARVDRLLALRSAPTPSAESSDPLSAHLFAATTCLPGCAPSTRNLLRAASSSVRLP